MDYANSILYPFSYLACTTARTFLQSVYRFKDEAGDDQEYYDFFSAAVEHCYSPHRNLIPIHRHASLTRTDYLAEMENEPYMLGGHIYLAGYNKDIRQNSIMCNSYMRDWPVLKRNQLDVYSYPQRDSLIFDVIDYDEYMEFVTSRYNYSSALLPELGYHSTFQSKSMFDPMLLRVTPLVESVEEIEGREPNANVSVLVESAVRLDDELEGVEPVDGRNLTFQ